MKKATALCIVVLLCAQAFALDWVEGTDVVYMGGSAIQLKPGDAAKLDLTQADRLIIRGAGSQLEIPYASITRYSMSEKIAHHLGVLPTIAVGLVKLRRRRHYLNVEFTDAAGVHQAAVFEISKTMPQVLEPVLESRVPKPKPEPRQPLKVELTMNK